MGLFSRRQSNSPCDSPESADCKDASDKLQDAIAPVFASSMTNVGTARVDMSCEVNADADLMFSLLSDPFQHERIFKAIEGASARLLEHNGPRKKYELDYSARWKFWKVSGVAHNLLMMETDAEKRTVHFKLRQPGFLKVYEGTWSILPVAVTAASPGTARDSISSGLVSPLAIKGSAESTPRSSTSSGSGGSSGSLREAPLLAAMTNPLLNSPLMGVQEHTLSSSDAPSSPPQIVDVPDTMPLLDAVPKQSARSMVTVTNMLMSPKRAPPYPLNHTLKGQAIGQVQEMLEGLLEACSSASE